MIYIEKQGINNNKKELPIFYLMNKEIQNLKFKFISIIYFDRICT